MIDNPLSPDPPTPTLAAHPEACVLFLHGIEVPSSGGVLAMLAPLARQIGSLTARVATLEQQNQDLQIQVNAIQFNLP